MMKKKTDQRNLLLKRSAALRRFNVWEANHPITMGTEEVISVIGAIYDLMPLESRRRPLNPEGWQEMHRSLSHLTCRP